jgi:hypothetical protein
MKKLICVIGLFCTASIVAAQQKKTVNKTNKTVGFPTSFIGHWKGTLQWMVVGKIKQSFTMQLIVKPTDSIGQYTWQIIYGDSATDNRPYLLKPIDTAKGHWVIDETDGIVLDSYVFGNSIKGAFTVMNNTVVDSYTVDDNTMRVEFLSINLNKKNITGKGTAEVPFVDSYAVKSAQSGTLVRIRK